MENRFKICTKCNEEKPLTEFYKDITHKDGLHSRCKTCHKYLVSVWAKNNKHKRKEIVKRYCDKNREELNKKSSEYYKKNPEKVKASKRKWVSNNKERYIETAKEYRKRTRERRRFLTNKMNQNPDRKLNMAMHSGIYISIKKEKRKRKWEVLAGYTLSQLKEHLSSLFVDGMSWDNYGEWHIDHIIPKSFFDFKKPEDEGFKKCWELENLQPLWAKDNIIKKDKINTDIQQRIIQQKGLVAYGK